MHSGKGLFKAFKATQSEKFRAAVVEALPDPGSPL